MRVIPPSSPLARHPVFPRSRGSAMWVGRCVAELPTPAFVVDEAVARRNAERMLQRCRALGLRLRPHMKTHKTL